MKLDLKFEESEQTFEMNVAGSIVVNGGGKDGKDGKDGYTPQRGIDYWTEEDKQEIVDEVIEQLPDIPSGGGVNADWSQNDPTAPDYVKNRTHWVETFPTIEWDGSRDGRDSFDASAMGFGVCYKVSDEVWTQEQAETGFIRTVQANGEEVDRTDNCAVLLNDDAIGFVVSYIKYPLVQVAVFFAKQAADLTDVYGFSIPSAGCYFLDDGFAEDFGGGRLVLETPPVIHKLDYEYLPEDIATEAKVEEMISNALGAVENGTY